MERVSKLNTITLDQEGAQGIAAIWAAWIAGDARLETGDLNSEAVSPLLDVPFMGSDVGAEEATWQRIEVHARTAPGAAARADAGEGHGETRPSVIAPDPTNFCGGNSRSESVCGNFKKIKTHSI